MQNMDAQNAHANPLFVKAYETTALSYAWNHVQPSRLLK